MPTVEVASTAQVEPLIVPLRVAPLSGDLQVTVGASAFAAKATPESSARDTSALIRRTLPGNLCVRNFIGTAPSLFLGRWKRDRRMAIRTTHAKGSTFNEISSLGFTRRIDRYGSVVRR